MLPVLLLLSHVNEQQAATLGQHVDHGLATETRDLSQRINASAAGSATFQKQIEILDGVKQLDEKVEQLERNLHYVQPPNGNGKQDVLAVVVLRETVSDYVKIILVSSLGLLSLGDESNVLKLLHNIHHNEPRKPNLNYAMSIEMWSV